MAWAQTTVLQGAGRKDRHAWLEARSPEVELAAIRTALRLAKETNCPLHIVHTSIPEGVDAIAQARASGQAVTVETCAHYLVFTDEDFERLGPIAKCAPPLRDRARLEELWERILDGTIDCITSDHSPCPTEDKSRGNDDIWQAWGGISGIQSLVSSVLSEGQKRGLSLERTAELLATKPAKIAGLWPHKGEIRVGSDADLILVNLERDWTLEPEISYSRHRHSAYVGLEFSVWIEQVFLRGHAVTTDGAVIASPYGRWLRPSHLTGDSMTVQRS